MTDLTRLVEVLAAHRLVVNRSEQRPWCSCGWHGRPATDDHLAHQAQALVDAGLVATNVHDVEVAQQALRDAADDWQMGGWAEDLPAGDSRPALILGEAQRATDWLRARADQLADEEGNQ